MGRAMRWLRNLLGGGGGGKRENRESKDFTGYGGGSSGGEDRREKKRWSFGKSSKDGGGVGGGGDVVLGQNAATSAVVEAAWMRPFCAERDKEQSKHAIAVAAATAAAADAAVAAAQAAVAVFRLTSQGRGGSAAAAIAAFGSCLERHTTAAVKIQTAFRRYLAKKAFRALRALVKLQALVRGYLVRKQAAATLLSMQALIRAQSAVRAQRARTPPPPNDRKLPLEFRPRRSMDKFDETRSEATSSFHSGRLSSNLDISSNTFDRSTKIVEVDTGRPRSRSSRRSNPSVSDPSDDPPHSSSLSSPLTFQIPARIFIPDSDDRGSLAGGGEKGRLSVTAQSTPRWANHSDDAAAEEDGLLRRFLCGAPSYMANTRSFEAKSRSLSAPKQRPEADAAGGGRNRVPLSEVVVEAMETQRPWCRASEEAFSFKSAVAGKLDRSSEFYMQRKW